MERFSKLNYLEKNKALSKKVKSSLKEIGVPMDEHIYNVKRILWRRYCDAKAVAFVTKVIKFYDSLDYYDSLVFLCDFLESGRHYPYWYQNYMGKREYLKTRKNLLKMTEGEFYED